MAVCVRFAGMFKDNVRSCDVCEDVIPKGETYRVSPVTKDKAICLKD